VKIGITELLVIFVVALLLIGPDRLPAYAKKLGEAMAQFKKYSAEATKDIQESIVEPLQDAQRPLQEIDQAIRNNVKEVQSSLTGLQTSRVQEPPEQAAADGKSRQESQQTDHTIEEEPI